MKAVTRFLRSSTRGERGKSMGTSLIPSPLRGGVGVGVGGVELRLGSRAQLYQHRARRVGVALDTPTPPGSAFGRVRPPRRAEGIQHTNPPASATAARWWSASPNSVSIMVTRLK